MNLVMSCTKKRAHVRDLPGIISMKSWTVVFVMEMHRVQKLTGATMSGPSFVIPLRQEGARGSGFAAARQQQIAAAANGMLLAAAATRPGHPGNVKAAGANCTPWLSPAHRQVLEERLPWVDPFWKPCSLLADSLGCLAAGVLAPSYTSSHLGVMLSCNISPEVLRRVTSGQAILQVSCCDMQYCQNAYGGYVFCQGV
jgi:hypothetical protein